MKPQLKLEWHYVFAMSFVYVATGYGIWYVATHPFSLLPWLLLVPHVAVALFGISVGYHRCFTHQAVEVNLFMKWFLALTAVLAIEGPAKGWVERHTQHHKFADTDGDPHRPNVFKNKLLGFLWAHQGWILFKTQPAPEGYKVPLWIGMDPVLKWQNYLYWPFVAGMFAFYYLIAGWQGVFVCGFFGAMCLWHLTGAVNSLGHLFGTHAVDASGNIIDTGDARNIWWLALPTFGESLHANHHACPGSAFHGWNGRDLDPGKWTILALQKLNALKLGFVKTVRRPAARVHKNTKAAL